MNEKSYITFLYYQSKNIGGAEQLIINLTIGLNSCEIIPKIYCYSDSYLYKQLIDLNTSFVFIDAQIIRLKELFNYVNTTDVFVMLGINILTLRALKRCNPKLVIYLIHAETFLFRNKLYKSIMTKKTSFLMHKCNELGGLFFMDHSCYKTPSTFYNLSLDTISYLPIPINTFKATQYKLKCNSNKLVVTYIGRGDADWKVYPALKIYKDLLSLNIEVELHIITNTLTLFEKMFKGVYNNKGKVKVKYIVGLYGSSLSNYLLSNSDLHFSMGTAAIEGAKLGVPTILMDVTHKYFPDNYRYRWIYTNNKQYNLGFLITASNSFSGMNMEDIVSLYDDEISVEDVSVKCFEYVLNNHSTEHTVKELIQACELTKLTVEQFTNTKYFNTIDKYLKFRSLFRFVKIVAKKFNIRNS